MINLGERLRTIATFVPLGARLADIGSDHGHLPAWLLQQGQIEYAIAGEINPLPAARARATFRAADLDHKAEVREGDGLSVLQPGEADTLTISGLGGATIVAILEAAPAVLQKLELLILQPNVGGARLRYWLAAKGFVLRDEALAKEHEIIYEIIVAVPGTKAYSFSPLAAEIGPCLLKKRPAHFKARVRNLLWAKEKIAADLTQARTHDALCKRRQLLDEIEQLKALF